MFVWVTFALRHKLSQVKQRFLPTCKILFTVKVVLVTLESEEVFTQRSVGWRIDIKYEFLFEVCIFYMFFKLELRLNCVWVRSEIKSWRGKFRSWKISYYATVTIISTCISLGYILGFKYINKPILTLYNRVVTA